ncbi:PREDICTED: cytochrome P450 2F3-like isoform X2 [Thamnophis sirtalis]|uniref:Cytochrome P450 2F3-like isoform X2 n=1 Tax=Thamnophis sirtalis TaxID=35019 RepID=A0A6I9XDE7_9SAUR|nr:PREDICTED: cytochrome P450 2F3-like isoform X2 [Thamnophis sirtalis]
MEIPAATRTDLGGPFGILLAMAASCLLFRHFAAKKRFAGLPPGPPPLPFFGNMLQVDVKELIPSLRELSKTYGPLYTVHLGSRPCVVLSGYQVLKEALIDKAEEFSGRGDFPAVQMWSKGNGIVYGTGERWRQLRRFAIGTLKNFGMGKRSMEQRIKEEAQFLVSEFRKTQGRPFDPTFFLSCAGSNIICSLVFGERFEYTDEAFLTLLDLINSNWKLMSSTWGQLLFVFPNVMRCLPGPHQRIYANYLKLAKFVGQRLERNRQTLDPNCPRDFIDCFLIKIQQEKGNASSHFTEETMSKTTVNLFFAGTETVSSTLRYGLLILLRHPEVEEKLHEEIDQVIGGNRAPCMDDRSQMPYTDAVIHEIQRYADIVPMGVPHTVTRDIEFRGYRLPKGLNVIPLLCTSQFDPTQFKNPQAFDPTHFLDESGGFRRREAFMAFSAGKRVCLGEGLANMELFLFLTTILQNFRLKALTDPSAIDISPESTGLGSIPRPYQLCLLPQ